RAAPPPPTPPRPSPPERADDRLRLFCPAWGYSGGLVGHLGVDRGPRGVEQAVRAVAGVHLKQRLDRLRAVVHAEPRVTDGLESARQRGDRELVGVDVVKLGPGERGGYLGI